ncbi:MAG: 50S ribosomal protein L25 [Parcubacteria group bacterium]|nr:50S ribosomal protein L25 [Parcubacteria group bacterium]
MADFVLEAQKRVVFGKKVNRLRKQGKIPAILYGHGIPNLSLTLEERSFLHTLKEAGQNTILKLEVEEEGKEKDVRDVLIHEVDYDSRRGKPLHADLYQIRMDERVEVDVPLTFVGESEAVEVAGGVLVKALQSLQVEALPAQLPHEISVDISRLKTFEDTIYIRDLALPSGVTVLIDLDTPVASVAPPRSEEELALLEEKVEEKPEEVKVETEEEKAQRREEAAQAGENEKAEA